MPFIMQAGNVFPICYLGDNFPGVVAEIILSQRPMVVYMKGGVPEIILEDSDLILKIENNLIHELIKNIYFIFNNEPIGCTNLYNKIKLEFNPDTIVNKMLSSYMEKVN